MHELSLCQDLIDQVTELARKHRARSVASVRVQIGLLAGVEPLLLESAFTIARAGTVAEHAEMLTEIVPPRVLCLACGKESEASPSDLRCPACGSGDTRLVQGEELILARVELEVEENSLSLAGA
jgi:hydrogenase nickel incorporation protein HypA/HybF